MTTSDKTLILVRHAKSSWVDRSRPDHDRPLNEQGRGDAPEMARRLRMRGTIPDAVVSSSAIRALETARAFLTVLELDDEVLRVEPAIYGADVARMLRVVGDLDDGCDRTMLVGHNPTFSDLAGRLSGTEVGALSTCSVVTLTARVDGWSSVVESEMTLVDLDFPKKAG